MKFLPLIIVASLTLTACNTPLADVSDAINQAKDASAAANDKTTTDKTTDKTDATTPATSPDKGPGGDVTPEDKNTGGSATTQPSDSSSAPAASTAPDPNISKVKRLHLDIQNRFMRAPGDKGEVKVYFLDENEQGVDLKSPKVTFTFQDNSKAFKFDLNTGQFEAVKEEGTALVSAKLEGTDLETGFQSITVDRPGGGGGSSAPVVAAPTAENVSGTISFEF